MLPFIKGISAKTTYTELIKKIESCNELLDEYLLDVQLISFILGVTTVDSQGANAYFTMFTQSRMTAFAKEANETGLPESLDDLRK